jgi:hypothetical protein
VTGALVIGGYLVLTLALGWPGLLAAAAHIAVLALIAMLRPGE